MTQNPDSTAPIFRLCDPHIAATTTTPLLGLWQPEPPPAAAISFGGVGAPPPAAAIPTWHASLAADAAQAHAQLQRGEQRIHAAQHALADAPQRLDSLVAAARSSAAGGGTMTSFTLPTEAAALPQPEADLLDTLQHLAPPPAQEPSHFSIETPSTTDTRQRDTLPEVWHHSMQQVQAFLQHIREAVTHYALVETAVAGQMVGRTTIGWAGDARTTWHPTRTPAQAALHWRTLDMALHSRLMLLRTFVIVSQGLLKVAVLVSTGNVVLALPALWKFINTIIAEREARMA